MAIKEANNAKIYPSEPSFANIAKSAQAIATPIKTCQAKAIGGKLEV